MPPPVLKADHVAPPPARTRHRACRGNPARHRAVFHEGVEVLKAAVPICEEVTEEARAVNVDLAEERSVGVMEDDLAARSPRRVGRPRELVNVPSLCYGP